jgi:hypothetical protein
MALSGAILFAFTQTKSPKWCIAVSEKPQRIKLPAKFKQLCIADISIAIARL